MSMEVMRAADRASADAFFADLVTELNTALDLHPAGITQERAWLHFKQLGRKVSIDQIVTTLNRQVREGTLTSSKNHKNETVWRRSRPTTVAASPVAPAQAEPAPPPAPIVIPESVLAPEEQQGLRECIAQGVQQVLAPDADPTITREIPMASKKVAAPARRQRGALEAEIANALADGPAAIPDLAKALDALHASVWSTVKRMQASKRVRRRADGTWELTAAGAKKAEPARAGKPPAVDATPTKRKPGRPRATPITLEITAQLDRFAARLQPVEDLDRKVATLDQLIKVMPSALAEQLTRIRADFVRLAGA